MSFTGADNLDASIDKANAWLTDIDAGFGTSDRRLAYRVLRAWLHCLRDRLSVEVAAHFAAQLPELLRGVFFDGWNPSRVPRNTTGPGTSPGSPVRPGSVTPMWSRQPGSCPPLPGATCPRGWWRKRSGCCPPGCGNCWSRPRPGRLPGRRAEPAPAAGRGAGAGGDGMLQCAPSAWSSAPEQARRLAPTHHNGVLTRMLRTDSPQLRHHFSVAHYAPSTAINPANSGGAGETRPVAHLDRVPVIPPPK